MLSAVWDFHVRCIAESNNGFFGYSFVASSVANQALTLTWTNGPKPEADPEEATK